MAACLPRLLGLQMIACFTSTIMPIFIKYHCLKVMAIFGASYREICTGCVTFLTYENRKCVHMKVPGIVKFISDRIMCMC